MVRARAAVNVRYVVRVQGENVRAATSSHTAVTALLLCTACFPVEQVDVGEDGTELVWPTESLIDDFEDGDSYPEWSQLDRWLSYTWEEASSPIEAWGDSHRAPGFDEKGWGRALEYELPHHGGAILSAGAAPGFPINLAPFDELSFQAKHVTEASDSAVERSPPRVLLRVDCPAAAEVGVSPDFEPVSVVWSPPVTAVWRPFKIDLTRLTQPDWQIWPGAHIDDPLDCLGQAASFGFAVEPSDDLEEGHTVAGTLTLDDLWLRARPVLDPRFSDHIELSPWVCKTNSNSATCFVTSGAHPPHAPTMSFELPAEPETFYHSVRLCADLPAALDFYEFERLELEAALDADQSSQSTVPDTALVLGCSGVDAGGLDPAIAAPFAPVASKRSFPLRVDAFKPTPVPSFETEDCRAQVDQVCVSVGLEGEQSARGSLTLHRLVLR